VNGHIELGRREPRHGHCEPVGVVTGLVDVVRQIAGDAPSTRLVASSKRNRTEQRREIETIHAFRTRRDTATNSARTDCDAATRAFWHASGFTREM
jgi:hypothetical protein